MMSLVGGLRSLRAFRKSIRPAVNAVEEQPPEAQLGLLLPIIRPWDYEREYWTSLVFLDATSDIDTLNLFTRVCENCLFLFRSLADIPDSCMLFVRRQCERNLTFAVLHVALKVLSPDSYASFRVALVSHFRLYNLLSTLSIYLYIRPMLVAGLHVGHIDKLLMYQVVRGSPAFATARALFVGSGCIFPCLQGLPPVLPFAAELPIQLVYLFFSVKCIAPLAADVFSGPKYTLGTHQLCSGLSYAMPSPAALLRTPDARTAPAICGPQRAWVLVLFFQLFAGFCLPLYACYSYERRLKLLFLRQLHDDHLPPAPQQQPAPPAAISAPAAQQQRQQQQQQQQQQHAHPTPQCHPPGQGLRAVLLKAVAWQPPAMRPAAGAPPLARNLLLLLRSCLRHAAALYLLATLCWQLVVALQVPLATRAKLVTFQDGYRHWYWELLCGSDQPCCPA